MALKNKRKFGRMRLPKGEKKIQIVTYVQEKKIEALGGAPAVRDLIQTLVEDQYNQINLFENQKTHTNGTEINSSRP